MGELFSATALGAGILFMLNPCSFALLPSYLGVFLNITQEETEQRPSIFYAIGRAQSVSLAMCAGILAIFLPAGLFFTQFSARLGTTGYILNIVLGLTLVVLGFAILGGFDLVLKIPKLVGGSNEKTFVGMFIYGASYAIAAMGCSLPILIVGLSVRGDQDGFIPQLGLVISFSLGIIVMLTSLTVAIATGRSAVVGVFRKIMTKMNLITALILIPSGAYLAYYGWWEFDPINRPKGPVAIQENLNNSIQQWLNTELAGDFTRAAVLGILFLVANVVLAGMAHINKPVAVET